MIDRVKVMAGDGDYTEAARLHALRMAHWFQAKLDVIPAASPGAAAGPIGTRAPCSAQAALAGGPRLDHGAVRPPSVRANRRIARSVSGSLLVVGLPTGQPDREQPALDAVLHARVPSPDRAECLVLAVTQPPRPCRMVLVDYQWGPAGKAALRAAAEVAMRAGAAVTVLCVDQDRGVAEVLSAVAERLLGGYSLPCVATITRSGRAHCSRDVANAARMSAADLVVVGLERHGLLASFGEPPTRVTDDPSSLVRLPMAIAREQLWRMAS